MPLEVLREGNSQALQLIPTWNADSKKWTIGIMSPVVRVREGLADSIRLGAIRTYHMARSTYFFLYQMISGNSNSDSVGGPIMIAQMVGAAAQRGVSDLIYLVGYISLQLGIFNLLPIPALDGGHIFFLLVEKIKGGTLSKSFRINTQKIGFSLLMFLILYISFQDSLRLFQ